MSDDEETEISSEHNAATTEEEPEHGEEYPGMTEHMWGEDYYVPPPPRDSDTSPCSSDLVEECFEEGEAEEWVFPEEYGEAPEMYGEEEKAEEEEVPETMEERISLDSEYLKRVLGAPLTFALLDIATKRPTDPIHYLSHYLINWRWNGQNKETYEEEVRSLTAAREERIRAEKEKERQEMLRREEEEEERRRGDRVESAKEKSTVEEDEEDEEYTEEGVGVK